MAKISTYDLKKIRDDGMMLGHDIKARDVAFCVLRDVFSDDEIAYKMIYEIDASSSKMSSYYKSDKIKYLKAEINAKYLNSEHTTQRALITAEDISFEENKAELVKMLAEVDARYENGEIDYKDAAKLKVDIRTKLNDKFSVSDDTTSQVVFVRPKFNHICDKTGTECWLQTKEFAMEHWGLIDKPDTTEYQE